MQLTSSRYSSNKDLQEKKYLPKRNKIFISSIFDVAMKKLISRTRVVRTTFGWLASLRILQTSGSAYRVHGRNKQLLVNHQ